MTLVELKQALEARLSDSQVLLIDKNITSEVSSLLTPLLTDRLRITHAQITLENSQLVAQGVCQLFSQDIRFHLEGQEHSGGLRCQVSLSFPDHWHMEDSFPDLPQSFKPDATHPGFTSSGPSLFYDLVWEHAKLKIEASTNQADPSKLDFEGKALFPSGYQNLQGILAIPDSVDIHGSLTLRQGHTPEIDLTIAVPAGSLSIGTVHLSNVLLHLRTHVSQKENTQESTDWVLSGELAIGSGDPVTLTAEYRGDDAIFRFIVDAEPGVITVSNGVQAIVDIVGGDASEFSLPNPLNVLDAFSITQVITELDTAEQEVTFFGVQVDSDKTWQIIPDFLGAEGLSFHWMVHFPFSGAEYRKITSELAGTLLLGTDPGVRFDILARHDIGFTMMGELATGQSVNLTSMVTQSLGIDTALPEIDLDELTAQVDTSGDFTIRGALSSPWSFEVNHQLFAVEDLQFAIAKTGKSKSVYLSGISIFAGINFYVVTTVNSGALGNNGFQFEGGTVADKSISLREFVNWLLSFLGTSLPASVPDIRLSNLKVTFDSGTKAFGFEGETETEIAIPFLKEEHGKIHASVKLNSSVDTSTGHRQLTGYMEGDFTLGTSKFTLQYALGKDSHVFEASWESTDEHDRLGINTLLDAVGVDHDVRIPDGLDLNLTKVYLQYQAERETLKLVADSATYGEVFMILSKLPLGKPNPNEEVPPPGQGTWQFVFGWDYKNTNKFSDIPVLGEGLGAADIFHLDTVGLLISSADIKEFEIPEMPAFKQVQSGSDASAQSESDTHKPVGSGSIIPLGKGLAFVAEMDLANSDQGGNMPALREVVTVGKLTVMAAINPEQESFSITAMLQGGITIPTGGESNLSLRNPALSFIFNDGIVFQLYGDLSMHFDHETIDVRPALSISMEEIEFSVDVEFEEGWKKPMGIQGLTLDEVGFEMGVNLLPAPGVNLGLEGQSHIGNHPRATDNFAFVLEIIEEIPDPLVLSFYLDEVSVQTALDVFVPDVQVNLPDLVKNIKLTQVSFYWAESPTVLPDGSIAQPGLRFGGNLQLLDFTAHAALAIDQTNGISGDFETSPIHIGNVLSVTGHGEGIYLKLKDGKPLPLRVRPEDNSDIETLEVVPPGGPVFAFRTTQSPYLQMSLKVSFLGLLNEEVEALVSNDGIMFALDYDLGHTVQAHLDFTLNKTGFQAHSQFGIHLKADLGPIRILGVDFGTIHLDTGFDISMSIEASLEHFELKLNGEFDFEGARLSFPEIHLAFAPRSLAELPGIILNWIKDHVGEIFKDLFDAAGHLLKEGLQEVEHLAEEAGKEIAHLATEAEHEAERVISDAVKAVEHTAEEAAEEVIKIEQEAEKILTDAANEVEKLATEAVEAVEHIGEEITHLAQEAEQEIEHIGEEIAEEARQVAAAVSRLAQEAAAEVKAIADAVTREVSQILHEAERAAQAVLNAARTVVNALENEAKALWDEAKRLADAIANAAKQVGNAVEHAAKSVWHAVSKY